MVIFYRPTDLSLLKEFPKKSVLKIFIILFEQDSAEAVVHGQSYLRKEQAKTKRLITNDLNKSAAMETIEKRIEKKSHFQILFWQATSK
jgi:hypothetical protein